MKSKKKIHKLTGMYVKILNMPTEHSSKLDNIYLVSLCETDNFKQSYTSLDYILENIVAELNLLANIGIELSAEEINFKGSLANPSFDNLGGNGICGFTESFVQDHFCRHCNKHKLECRTLTREDPTSLRNIAQHECISEVQQNNGDKIVLGIKKYCLLNDVKHFHIITNRSVDLLHDVNASLIPKTLNKIFSYCVQHKILTKNQIVAAIRDFNYGNIDSQKKPSVRDLDRLGQSASQLYTIITFLPIILRKQRDKLKDIWICVETALQIMQILYSSTIAETDVCLLETLIDKYLSNMRIIFDMHLTPKLHFLTHYSNVIRDMGPVIHS